MVLAKIWKFLYPFFLFKTGQEKVFGDVLDRKQAFLDYRNIDLKKPQNLHLSKGVSPWFWPNYEISLSLLLAKIGKENIFGNVLDRKRAFLNYKNIDLQKLQNLNFFKGVSPWFWPKLVMKFLFLDLS